MKVSSARTGFTIIELMIVIVIIALALGGVALGLGTSTRSQLRSSAWTLASASRYAFARAVSRGTTVRLVIDLDNGTLQLQETTARLVLNRQDETGEGTQRQDLDVELDADGNLVDASLSVRLWRSGSSITTGFSSSTSTASSSDDLLTQILGAAAVQGFTDPYFQMLDGATTAPGATVFYMGPTFELIEESQGKERRLKGNTRVQRVFSPHAPQPIEDGMAFVYFFPGGTTEHTFIQVNDGNEDEPMVYTLEVHPLTGKVRIHREEIEPPHDYEEEEAEAF